MLAKPNERDAAVRDVMAYLLDRGGSRAGVRHPSAKAKPMAAYLLRCLVLALITILVTTDAVTLLIHLMPGDPVQIMYAKARAPRPNSLPKSAPGWDWIGRSPCNISSIWAVWSKATWG